MCACVRGLGAPKHMFRCPCSLMVFTNLVACRKSFLEPHNHNLSANVALGASAESLLPPSRTSSVGLPHTRVTARPMTDTGLTRV